MLKSLHRVLQNNGEIIIENPDLSLVVNDLKFLDPCSLEFFERVRALYAFDMSELNREFRYMPYRMSYRAEDIEFLAVEMGFVVVHELPEIHTSSYSRDLRLRLIKR